MPTTSDKLKKKYENCFIILQFQCLYKYVNLLQ